MSWAYDFSSCILPIYSRQCWWNITSILTSGGLINCIINPPFEESVDFDFKVNEIYILLYFFLIYFTWNVYIRCCSLLHLIHTSVQFEYETWLDSQCTMLKHHAHPLVPAMVQERTCLRPRQKPSTLLSLYYFSSPQTPCQLFDLDRICFW